MSVKRWCWPVLAASAFALLVAGCSDPEAEVEITPEIVAFTASPESVQAGEPIRLSWATQNAKTVQIADGQGAVVDLGNAIPRAGAVEVTPVASTTFELTAISSTGNRVRSSVSVEVKEIPQAPSIASFVAAPTAAAYGEPVSLTWTTERADSIRITRAGGQELDLGGSSAAAGSVEVPVLDDTTYTLTATNAGGSVEATVQVKVATLPVVSFTGPAAPVVANQDVALRWTTTGATQVKIVDASGAVLVEGSEKLSGELIRNEPVGNSFTLTATGPGGTVVREARIDVQPVIERFVILTEGPVRTSGEVEVEWQMSGAATAEITNLSDFNLPIPANQLGGGRATIPVGPGGAILLRARDGSLAAEKSLPVDITWEPRIRSFTSDHPQVSARPELPAAVTISWLVDGASLLHLDRTPGGSIDVNGLSPRADSVSVTITEETTFHLVATNDVGTHEATWTVGVVPAPRIASFDAIPDRVGTGEGTRLSWNVEDAAAIRIEREGVDLGIDPTLGVGTYDDFPLFDSTYVLVATNSLGFEVRSEPVQVGIGAPIVASFTVDRPVIPAQQLLTFQWSSRGGRNLVLSDADGNTLCSTSDVAQIRSGSCSINVPLVDGLLDYTLQVTNGVGAITTATVQVQVVAGPIVQAFTASVPGITLGEPVTFSWDVDNDAQNRPPILSLADDLGNVYDVSGSNPNVGSATIVPVAAGATSFILTASTADTTASTATVPMMVYGVPNVATLTANPDPIDTAGGTVPPTTTLSWTVENGASLSLYRLNSTGNPITPALFATVAPSEVAAGSYLVTASIPATSFRVVVVNGAGATAQRTIRVAVDPAEIVQFTADSVELLRGETGTLRWDTRRAANVTLLPTTASTTFVANGYQDISTIPGNAEVTLTAAYNGVGTINFPAGFTFPWFGQQRSAAVVATGGWLSFNLAATGTISNFSFPRPAGADVQLAPFFDAIQPRSAGGRILWVRKQDTSGDYLVIQWTHFAFATSLLDPSELNFQLWLRSDGRVEFHYGPMSSPPGTREYTGETATIGWQNPTGSTGQMLIYGPGMPGGLTGKGYSLDFHAPLPSGSWNIYADETRSYVLEATNPHSTASASLEVRVYEPVAFTSVTPTPEPEVNTPFTIDWNVRHATSVTVLDAQGNQRCSSSALIGSCTLTEAAVGDYTYTVRAVGTLTRDVQSRTVQVHVWDPIAVNFTASSNSVVLNESATLSWNNVGITSLTLTANGQPVSLGSNGILSGSITVQPTASTHYTMTGTDGTRVRTVELDVAVRAAGVSSFTASPTQIFPGQAVTINWNTSGAPGAWVDGMPLPSNPATDVSANVAFEDLTGTGTELTLNFDTGYVDLTFPASFSFPYFGRQMTAARIFAYGYVSFTPDASASSSNVALPAQGASQTDVHLAPFWDAIKRQLTGSMLTELRSDAAGRYLVIQWKGWQFTGGSGANLNFEVVLREDGTFEYRYGTMTAPTQAQANGSGATIGFQDPWSTRGYTYQFNLASAPPRSNTAIRFDYRQPASGSYTATPSESTTYTVCNTNLGYTECRDQRVVVVKPGDLMFSEVMLKPSGNPSAEWIELRNVTADPIDISGFVVAAGNEQTTISPTAPLVVQPGAFAVLSHAGGPVADWNYGTAITLDDIGEILVLSHDGAEFDRVDTTSLAWTITQGRSLQLDPIQFQRIAAANDDPAVWCTSTAADLYDGTNGGTPGTLGSSCLRTDYDVDVASSLPFIDIAATGTSVPALTGGNTSVRIPGDIGFNLPFFNGSVSALFASSDGFLVFNTISGTWSSNATIPSANTPNGGIAAPFWDDLDNTATSSFLWERRTVGNLDVTILQWQDFRRATRAGRITFQVQLWSDGDLVYAYKELVGTDPYNRGGNATVGLEDASGTVGIQYLLNEEKLYSGQAIHFMKK